jgi:hypothetical protein
MEFNPNFTQAIGCNVQEQCLSQRKETTVVQYCTVVKGRVSWAVPPCGLVRALHEQTEARSNDLDICEYHCVPGYDTM